MLLVPGAAGAFSISADSLRPEFREANRAYTVKCSGPVKLRVESGGKGAKARIGRGSRFRGSRSKKVRLEPSQAVVVRKGKRRYTVRCIPPDFFPYRYKQELPGRVKLFAVTPLGFGGGLSPNYLAVFNRWGTPVWWLHAPQRAIDASALADGTIAYSTYFGGGYGSSPRQKYRLVRPNGRQVGTLQAKGAPTDHHDLVPTRDGNYLILAYKERRKRINTAAFNGDRRAKVIDSVIQKLTPEGKVLWRWNSRDHIRLAETGRWWPGLEEPYDITHINSVEELRSGDLLISLRHTDAVYRIDKKTGKVEWKLGGTKIPRSLKTSHDPNVPLFGGQHDARQLPDGTITVFDNGSELERRPRAVRYRIQGNTARLIAQVRDPFVSRSRCCGSARRLPGSWLVSWGGTGLISGLTPHGRRIFTLDLFDLFSYRATPLTSVSERRLIKGMNKQFPLAR